MERDRFELAKTFPEVSCATDQQMIGILCINKPSTCFRGWEAVKQVPSGFLTAHTCPFA
jgi:hypothetical protein